MKKIKRIGIVLLGVFIILNILLQIVLSMSNSGLTLIDIYSQSLPKKDKITIKYKKKYLIKNKTKFEYQGLNQCAGFSTAYVFRMNGISTSGASVYDKLPHKFSNGYVMPQGVIAAFKQQGMSARIYKGSFEQMQTRLNEGKPLITLLGEGRAWQHYVTIIGYDKNNVYLVDSLKEPNNSLGYNRVYTKKEFKRLWNNQLPIFNNIYYVYE